MDCYPSPSSQSISSTCGWTEKKGMDERAKSIERGMKNSVGGVGFWPGVESSPAGPPGSMSDGMVKINVHLICPAKGRGQ